MKQDIKIILLVFHANLSLIWCVITLKIDVIKGCGKKSGIHCLEFILYINV